MDEQLLTLFEKAETLSDIFEVVKATVEKTTGKSRGGIMLGLATSQTGSSAPSTRSAPTSSL
jgi:hypothetical protein